MGWSGRCDGPGAVIVALDLLEGPCPQFVGLLVAVPLIAAAWADVAGTAVVAAAGAPGGAPTLVLD